MKQRIRQYKGAILYLIFGAATTLVNWAVYSALMTWTQIPMTVSNGIAWFAAVVFAYITNKKYVFESRSWRARDIAGEIGKFFGARIVTGAIEIVGLPLLYDCGVKQSLFGVEGFLAKILVSVLVVILNYIFSKIFVFTGNKEG